MANRAVVSLSFGDNQSQNAAGSLEKGTKQTKALILLK